MPTLTVTYPVELQAALDRALAEYGATVVDELVTNWLRDRERAQDEADWQAIRAGKADPAMKARVRARFGL